jgi:hypothetical protein
LPTLEGRALNTVSGSERGEKRPEGASLKLVSLVKAKGLATIAQAAGQAGADQSRYVGELGE